MSRAPAMLWSSFSGSTQPSTDTPVRITSIGWLDGRQALERVCTAAGRPRSRLQLRLVAGELGGVRQLAVHQQVGDFLEFAAVGDVEDVVAAVVQVVAGAADGAQRGVAGGDAGQGDGFFGLKPAAGASVLLMGSLSRPGW